MSVSVNNHDQSLNGNGIDELIFDDDEEVNIGSKITSKPSDKSSSSSSSLSSCLTKVQDISLSLEKALANTQTNGHSSKLNSSILSNKTSNIPGPVGLLPILKTNEELRDIKENKAARTTIITNEENGTVTRPKSSSELFSLNIDNYPSYYKALVQLQQTFGCQPISIKIALVKARLGIKKRIPLMCVTVTHYNREENTVLLDDSGHIRATFIGDDEVLDSINIRVGHTLVLRNVAVFTSIRHRHHYVNIHLQNIVAIQDPLMETFNVPFMSGEFSKVIEDEISAYADSSNINNETIRIFSQSDHEDDEQPPTKKSNTTNSAFNRIQTKPNLSSSTNKFKETISEKSTAQSIVPQSSTNENDPQKHCGDEINPDDLNDEFFSSW